MTMNESGNLYALSSEFKRVGITIAAVLNHEEEDHEEECAAFNTSSSFQ